MPISINYCSPFTLACHYSDNYFSFAYSPYYWGFAHMFFSFVAVILSYVNIKPRSIGAIFTGLWVFFVGTMFMVFQDISVVSNVAGSALPPWTQEWEAGEVTFKLLWNFIGVLFGLLFLWMANPFPNVALGIQKPTEWHKHSLHWALALFIFTVLIPLAFIGGGLGILHIGTAYVDITRVFRLDMVIFAVYVDACLAIYWLVRRSAAIKHITACALMLEADIRNDDSEKPGTDITPDNKTTEEQVLTSGVSRFKTIPNTCLAQVKSRIDAEMTQLMIVATAWMLLMMFVWVDWFFFQTVITCTVTMVIFVIVRAFMGTASMKRFQFYDRPLRAATNLSATGSIVGFEND